MKRTDSRPQGQPRGKPPSYYCTACARPLRLPPGADTVENIPVCGGCRPIVESDRVLHRLVQRAHAWGVTLREVAPFSVYMF